MKSLEEFEIHWKLTKLMATTLKEWRESVIVGGSKNRDFQITAA